MPSLRIIGPGRMGGALALAAASVGWTVATPLGSRDDLTGAAQGVDLLMITTPDRAVAEVAGLVAQSPTTVVAHMSGSLGLAALDPHRARGCMHPLIAAASSAIGARRLLSGATFAVSGDQLLDRLATDLGGLTIAVSDEQRPAYHAAACIASNHVVAMLGQAERVAATVGVPLAAYLDLVRATVDNVAELGPAAALTGPAARGDDTTIAAHLAALDQCEHDGYLAGVRLARRLADQPPAQTGEST